MCGEMRGEGVHFFWALASGKRKKEKQENHGKKRMAPVLLGGRWRERTKNMIIKGKGNFFSSFRENAHFPDQLSLLISRISDFFAPDLLWSPPEEEEEEEAERRTFIYPLLCQFPPFENDSREIVCAKR